MKEEKILGNVENEKSTYVCTLYICMYVYIVTKCCINFLRIQFAPFSIMYKGKPE